MNYAQYRPTGFKFLPPVVKNILIISGLFYLAKIGFASAFLINLEDLLGMHYFASEKFKFYQLITYMFMHGDFSHIFFNMFAFWMFGYVLENVWGSKRFLIFFLVTGLGAALIQMLVFYFETAPVLDAINTFQSDPSLEKFKHFMESENFRIISNEINNKAINFQNHYNSLIFKADSLTTIANTYRGADLSSVQNIIGDSLHVNSDSVQIQAINALEQSKLVNEQALSASIDFITDYRKSFLNAPLVVGASGAVFGILLAFGMMFPNSRIYIYFAFPIKAKWFVIFYGAIELFAGIANTSGDNVAHFAHLGGMLFGLILILLWRKKSKPKFFE